MTINNLISRDQLAGGKIPVAYRAAEVMPDSINVDDRTVEISFSSEYPVERWGWVEVLGHDEGECDLGRISDSGPFLSDHNWSDQRGVIVEAYIRDGRGMAKIKLSRNPLGEQLLIDFQDGIKRNVSVSYRIEEAVLTKKEQDVEFYRVTRWVPLEISSVSVPADPTVGLGRADKKTLNQVRLTKANIMNKEELNLDESDANEGQRQSPTKKEGDTEGQTARARQQDMASQPDSAKRIAETAAQYGAVDLGNEFIRSGKSFDEFRDALTKQLHSKRSDPTAETTSHDLDLELKDLKRYSVIKALRAAATGNWKNAGLERNISNAIAERSGKDAEGVFLSYEALGFGLRQRMESGMHMERLQSAGGATFGAELVSTELHSELFINALRAKAVVAGLGARFLSGLVGDVDIPKQSGSATFYWVAEDGEPTDSSLTFTTVQLRPKTIATAVPLTRRLMVQSTPDIESLVRDDIMLGMALGIDNALLSGTGLSNQPTGILNTAGIGAVDITGGVTWAKIVELETDTEEANVDAEMSAYVMRPGMKGTLKTTEKATGTAKFLWDDGTVNGYKGQSTTQMSANEILFGDFSQAMVGLWGALDVVPDTATKAASGGLVMRMFQDADVAVRHAQAFTLAS